MILGSTPWVVRYKRSFLLKYRLHLHSWGVEVVRCAGKGWGFFYFSPRWCLVRVRVKDGRGEAKVSQCTADKGAGGVHKGHFHIPGGMVVRGGRRHSICQPAFLSFAFSFAKEQRDIMIDL